MRSWLPLFLAAFALLAPEHSAAVDARRKAAPAGGEGIAVEGREVQAEHGMVVSASLDASRIGRDILIQDGNAVDAAVATAFALAVTWPEAGNIGGGGFMMVLPEPGATPVCVEYRETAPAGATADMFLGDDDRHSGKMVGVPGTVRGLALAHARYGRLPWKALVLPAARLARRGFQVDDELASSIRRVLEDLPRPVPDRFAELVRVYGRPDERDWRSGDRLLQPELAATLTVLAEQGPDAFYEGPLADKIVATVRRAGGCLSGDDLKAYRANVRPAVHGTYRGHDVWGPPPPSSGGICLVEALNILEGLNLRESDRLAPRNLHLMAEALRRGFRDRAEHLGDPAFAQIPAHLTDKDYARQLAGTIDARRATASESLADTIPLAAEGPDTTHFSVIDSSGMAVSNTYTLEASWGSRIVVSEAGFLLNNEMGDFNRRPGHTDRQGAIGTAPNRIAPGKRMLSSQTPVLVTKEGRPILITGSPGGRTIISTVLQVVLNVLEFEMDLPESVATPRIHHGWFPDQLLLEQFDDPRREDLVTELEAMGHRVEPVKNARGQGAAHSIIVEPTGEYLGFADARRGGAACGY